MCEPTTIAIGAVLLAGGLGGMAMVQSGQYADAAGKQQQKLLDQQALQQMSAAEIEADKVNREYAAAGARQQSLLAASGADLGGELAYSLAAETEEARRFETELIYTNARNQASLSALQGRMARAQGRQSKAASYLNAGSTVIGSIGSAYAVKASAGTPPGTPIAGTTA